MLNRSGLLISTSIFLLFCLHYTAIAQEDTDALRKELNELKQDQKSLHEDLKMIKDLLLRGQRPSSPPSQADVRDVEFELGDNPVKGSDTALLVIVEFSDYQCSFCKRHTNETYPEIFEKYIKTGKLRYAIMDKPLPSHDMANEAAEAAHCAAEQGKFWEMHEEMLTDSESLYDLASLASSLGLDIQKFRSCTETKKYAERVASNLSLANKLNVPSVPGFVIASSDPVNPKKVKGISFIRGAKPFIEFQQKIEQALAGLSD